jgi:hypothetical protein
MEMRRYQEALNRAKGMDVNSEAYARNKAIAEQTGAKYGLNWQKGLTTGAQPQQQQDQRSAYEQELNRQRGPQLDTTANAQGQYRLSPGVYGTKEQAQQSYDQEMEMQRMRGGPNVLWGGSNPYNDKMYRYPATQGPMSQEDYESLMRGVTNMGEYIRGPIPGATQGIYNAPQPPQQDMTANKQGKYRLSPGMYGNRQQAEQQQARDMGQYNQQQEAQRAAMEAARAQQQNQGGGGVMDRYGQYLGGIGANAGNYYGGIAKGAGDYYGGIAKGAGDYYSGTAKGVGNYYGNVGKETNRSLPAARLGRKFGW